MKTLVVFYSLEGSTRRVANLIREMMNADALELMPAKDSIGSERDKFGKYLLGGKQAVMRETPELKPIDVRPEDYELIFLGTPVWAWTYAPALRTFFKEHAITNKKIALFCTHEGGMKNTLLQMKEALPDNTFIGSFDFMNVKKTGDAELAAAVKLRLEELKAI
jgi:flavodoxin